MMLKRIDPNSRRSRAVVAGNMVYLGGQVGDDKQAGIRIQTQQALAKIDSLLKETGSSRAHIVSATIWLKTMGDYDGMNAVWDEWLDPSNPPARACGEVRLADDGYRVEIIATAALA
jgi:enamine deaminase RidA (YjgF/YER057c/UK114 family)